MPVSCWNFDSVDVRFLTGSMYPIQLPNVSSACLALRSVLVHEPASTLAPLVPQAASSSGIASAIAPSDAPRRKVRLSIPGRCGIRYLLQIDGALDEDSCR